MKKLASLLTINGLVPTYAFRRIFFLILHHIQILTFDMNAQSGSCTLVPLPASASTKSCHFHRLRFHIPADHTATIRFANFVISVAVNLSLILVILNLA